MALFDRVHEIPIKNIISAVVEDIKKQDVDTEIVIYTPDAGAYKRYSSLLKTLGIPFVYGEKMRDFATGKIEGLRVITNGLDLKGKTVLMIDDIIAYGGTFYYSAQELKKQGVKKIYAYASHTENSILEMDTTKETPELKSKFLKMIYQGEVERLFTTNTIFRQASSEHINVREFNGGYCHMILYDNEYETEQS
jgi:ribose-phosphate pyrophosphokinase